MDKIAKIVGVLAILCAPMAQAGLLQLNFSGTMTHFLLTGNETSETAFSGSIIIDSSVPDSRPEPGNSRFFEAVVGGSVQWDGLDYNVVQSQSQVFLRDDNATFNDIFAAIFEMESANGTTTTFGLQFADFTQSAFSSDAIPDGFELSDFSAFDPFNANSTFGVVLGPNVFGAFDFAELVAIPNAPTVWLALFGGTMLLGRRSRRRAIGVTQGRRAA